MTTGSTHVKHVAGMPPGFYETEAVGLSWLAQAHAAGGAAVVPVRSLAPARIEVERIETLAPSRAAARSFGSALARTHAAGAPWPMCAPPEAPLEHGWIGTAAMEYATGPALPWGPAFARHRIEPYLPSAAPVLGDDAIATLRRVCERLSESDPDLVGPPEPAARLHGDLWSGNLLWSRNGVVLIDPAAHGGHRESDLAMLALFGCPHLGEVLAAYDEQDPLAPDWQHRVALHQLFPLLVHVVLFGASYAARTVSAAQRYAT